ncbi:pPIWI-associating nuclease domain-containing protein [Dyadobacter psychrotolerans]|uniref:Uncharacterized protein n=1 Tax=Dyadobacter psychrotolerans TaxID=2541721 RepID=A0A4R5DMM0_9BACT|nr:hypothetical protein [Dyadobacter psychrotolerans]TDE14757.1 hypothetical protein E0F88_16355 [Dyadobacter psychrotolerans]
MSKKQILKDRFKDLLTSDFQRELLDSALTNLFETSNKLRFNNFSYVIRELANLIINDLAPEAEVLKCNWFTTQIGKANKVVRRQKIRYALSGGLSDKVLDQIDFDHTECEDALLDSINILNQYTHINETTFGAADVKIEDLTAEVINSLFEFLEGIKEYRESLVRLIEANLNEQIFSHCIESTYSEIDILASRSRIEDVEVNNITVTGINFDFITANVSGYVHVVLEYGYRNDSAEMNDSFPFECTTRVDVKDFKNIEVDPLDINTESWYDNGEEDKIDSLSQDSINPVI